jgi:uncharacterized protein YggT (Ycf19 family)
MLCFACRGCGAYSSWLLLIVALYEWMPEVEQNIEVVISVIVQKLSAAG